MTQLVFPHYTYEDYAKWEGRWELLRGTAIMSPSPSPYHQIVAKNLTLALHKALRQTKFTVIPECDFIISSDITLRPDIAVYEHLDMRAKYPTGKTPPALVIEVLSPSNFEHDMINKFAEYLAAGVQCYVVVSPEKETIEIAFGIGEHDRNVWRFPALYNIPVVFEEIF